VTVFTHFSAGALLGYLAPGVASAALLGLASHVLLDFIPHFDFENVWLEIIFGSLVLAVLIAGRSCTAAICTGGLVAVLPDVENLLWKTGVMDRKHRIFPSHSGMIPHGREAGKINLAAQVIFTAAVVTFLLWSNR
jgi:hypothetical protein